MELCKNSYDKIRFRILLFLNAGPILSTGLRLRIFFSKTGKYGMKSDFAGGKVLEIREKIELLSKKKYNEKL